MGFFHSCLSSSELASAINKSLNSKRTLFSSGPVGGVAGSTVHVRCASGAYHNGLAPVFHGHITETVTGSFVTGRISASRHAQFLVAAWSLFIIIFSLLFVWTIIFPLFGCLLLFLGYGVICLGDRLRPDDENNIRIFFNKICKRSDCQ